MHLLTPALADAELAELRRQVLCGPRPSPERRRRRMRHNRRVRRSRLALA